jgi:hypothetical protein
MSDLARLYDLARSVVTERGFDADLQTKVALFLGATSSINAALLAPAQLPASATAAYPFLHGQYFREVEFTSLLARVTRWSANPLIYTEAAWLTAPLWTALWKLPALGLASASSSFQALALGHALLGRVRLTPVLPENIDELDPFVVALRRIEQENGRMIQAQIRLLKDASASVDPAERERIVAEQQAMVDALFLRFLGWFAGQPAGSASAK